ncbi:hypothetical protein Bhyg_00506 [Pseudolycoriella hygida]|uniref:Uncharacterized protein n=1 Tax=Pseudolycoriella hygida TaxID=35572 RepID=A0A9Q0N7N6_9DIPT|nr:hypothetical protein Bhyg_00506 [Pseudolycoriella hygida]
MNLKPKTRSMKCLTACLLEKSDKIANKKFDTQGVIKSIEKYPNVSNKLRKSVTELVMECGRVTEPDRCEYASKIVDCLIAGAAKRGIQPTPQNGFAP